MRENLIALITGGGRGIGEATSRMLLEVGYEVISVGLHKPEWTHAQFQHYELDLLDDAKTRQFSKACTSCRGFVCRVRELICHSE